MKRYTSGGNPVRRVAHFSCGAASAVAAKISNPDEIWYCDTGAEDADNARFMRDCEQWFGQQVRVLHSDKYRDTWDVWESRRYIAGINGAPCTGELKVLPRVTEKRIDDIHIFGFTADANDMRRAAAMADTWPDIRAEFPLIDRGLTKAACFALVKSAGLDLPRIYGYGFDHANCVPCPKATSPDYWARMRRYYPAEFQRMALLSRELGAKLVRVEGKRLFLDELPADWPLRATAPQPACDFLCQMADEDMR